MRPTTISAATGAVGALLAAASSAYENDGIDAPQGGVDQIGRKTMKLRISGLLAIAAFALAGLFGSAQTLAQNAYITNFLDGTVSVINTQTDLVTATISQSSDFPAPRAVSVTLDGSKVYITNVGNHTVAVIDTATNTVTATIPLQGSLFGLAVTPDGRKLYVANQVGSVAVIDTETNTVTATIPVGDTPDGVAVTPDGRKVFVTNISANNVSVIDTASDTVTATIPVGINPLGLAVSPDGSKVYVACVNSNAVLVIDAATNAVIASIPDIMTPNNLAVAPDGSALYVTGPDGIVLVINTATNTVSATIPILGIFPSPFGVGVTPDGRKVFVTNINSNNVSVIDTASDTVVDTIPVGRSPIVLGIFIQPAPRFAGTPGHSNCYGKSVSALARQFKGLNAAAADLGFASVGALQNVVMTFCEG
jgi:YVTN family beta-propeller protein